jgi:hypothetical protein
MSSIVECKSMFETWLSDVVSSVLANDWIDGWAEDWVDLWAAESPSALVEYTGECKIMSLPNELLQALLAYLDPKSSRRMGAVCRFLHATVVDLDELLYKPMLREGQVKVNTWFNTVMLKQAMFHGDEGPKPSTGPVTTRTIVRPYHDYNTGRTSSECRRIGVHKYMVEDAVFDFEGRNPPVCAYDRHGVYGYNVCPAADNSSVEMDAWRQTGTKRLFLGRVPHPEGQHVTEIKFTPDRYAGVYGVYTCLKARETFVCHLAADGTVSWHSIPGMSSHKADKLGWIIPFDTPVLGVVGLLRNVVSSGLDLDYHRVEVVDVVDKLHSTRRGRLSSWDFTMDPQHVYMNDNGSVCITCPGIKMWTVRSPAPKTERSFTMTW